MDEEGAHLSAVNVFMAALFSALAWGGSAASAGLRASRPHRIASLNARCKIVWM